MHKFFIPSKTGESPFLYETKNNITIIGANGAGKTRFGVLIEELNLQKINIHRISAQKALMIPEYATIKNLEKAETDLLYSESYNTFKDKLSARTHGHYSGNPSSNLINDYDRTLSLLFAKETERDRKYVKDSRSEDDKILVPDSPIDVIIKLWSELLPHRKISLNDSKVSVHIDGGSSYHGMDMSDGERVILYHMAQCLCLPENCIIIIDEPEIHIHKSIINKLWDKIEKECPGKLFIYITHDLEFASSRIEAQKFWINSYGGFNKWQWVELSGDEDLPESLLLEILGNRKKVIFCEGEKSSDDNIIYQLVYPDFHIIPRGGGDKVIEATKAMRHNHLLHHLKAYGIIDSDYKEEEEKTALLKHNIHTLNVAEIENLFCIEPILRIVAENQGLPPDEKVREVTERLITALKEEFEFQITCKAEKIVNYRLGAFSRKANNKNGISEGIRETLGRIDVDLIYNQSELLFKEAIEESNLSNILLLYNRKKLLLKISPVFNFQHNEYRDLVLRLLKGEKQAQIVAAIKTFLPQLNDF